MQKAIENFCQKRKNGLFLLDMPTGFGKTYNVLEFIAENCDTKEYQDTNFFFVTTLKKNLPFEDLRERFKQRGKEKYFENKSLRIQANADVVIEKLLDLDKTNKIPKEIKSKSSYTELKELVTEIRKNGSKFADKIIRETAEREFREDVVKELEIFRTSNKKLEAIKTNPKYQWIGELYPSVFTKEKQIFFLTIDKFLLEYSTLIEKSYLFYNHSIIENAIIFIDEFDATKERMMNQIIQRGLKNSINSIKLANLIHSALQTKKFPRAMTTESQQRENYLKENPREKTCRQIIKDLKRVFADNHERFSMQYSIRTEHKDRAENERNFLFNDFQFHSIFSNGNAFVQMKVDSEARQNWLCFSQQESIEQEVSLPEYLGSVRGSINYFLNAVAKLAVNFKQYQDERKNPLDDDFSYENAITSVLEEFGIPDNFRYYMKMRILSKQQMRKNQKKRNDKKFNKVTRNLSIYDRGFRYYDFKDEPSHHMQSEIRLYDFPDSPESILLRVAERARVIGISATATLDTVIVNYSTDYLKQRLGEAFYTLPKEDKDRLINAFSKYTKGYNKVKFHVESVSCNDTLEKELKEIFNDEHIISRYSEILENKFSGDSNKYTERSFLRIVKVMKQFILNKEIRSLLCLSNKLAREGNHKLDLNLLREIAQEIRREANIKDDDKEIVVSIDSEEYDEKHANLIERLSNGEKLFVLSSYQTIGAGQNLQYKTPNDVAVVNVNDFNRGDLEKDFDAIYLENPTHLLVNVRTNDSLEDEDLIRYIFQMESLMECGEISQSDGKRNIKYAFRKLSGGKTPRDKEIGEAYKTDSVNNAANRVLIQAVGRICRTGLKNKDIYIYLDEEIFTKHDVTTVEHRMLNPEFVRIVDYGKELREGQKSQDSTVLKLENKASQLSSRHVQRINYLMRGWNPEKIEEWKELRELSLKYPTISKENYERYSWLYLQAPEKISGYSYSQEDDYQKNIMVKFDDSMPQKVSEEAARLQAILEIPGIKAYFEEKGYATEFTPSEYLLSPPMFNNIYKGALGEAAGKFILEKFLGFELQEVSEDVFEFFDFKIGDDVYVDFKHWKDTMLVDAEKAKNEIRNKLDACKGKRAVIINILLDREMQITTSYDRRIVEIPCLYRTDLHQYDSRIIKEVIRKGYLR